MQLKQLFKDDEAVSPVIGVILMVAITVILAAVIGTFVLGLGDQVSDSAPQSSLTFSWQDSSGAACTGLTALDAGSGGSTSDGNLAVTHDGGDKLKKNDLEMTDGSNTADLSSCSALSTDITAGTTWHVDSDSGSTVRVIWVGSDTATIGKWTGPDA